MINFLTIGTLLSSPKNIVITTHHKPDGDALGSSLAWRNILSSAGHQVNIISPSDFPKYFEWMPGQESILIFTHHEAEAMSLVNQADIIFCLDFNHLGRIYGLGDVISKATAYKCIIDHHLHPQDFDDFRFWDPAASSTSQLIYRFVQDLHWEPFVSQEAATCLYTGIVTDSGSFRFPRTTPELHRIVAALLELGVDNTLVQEKIYDHQSFLRVKFLGHCLKDRLEVIPSLNTAYFYLNQRELREYQIETGETEGIVNHALAIEGIVLAALFIEREDRVKISFRSKGEFPTNELSAKHFNGGGHKNAAGGESFLSLDDTVKKFKTILFEYNQLLVN